MQNEAELLPPENRGLTKREDRSLARQEPADLMRMMVEKGVTSENVAAFEKLAELQWKFEGRNAEKEFASAFVKLQTEMPIIVAKTVIPNRGKYERFEDLMRVIGPLLNRNGFSVSFSMDVNESRILETCHLKHIAGHTQSNSFAVRVGRADTETQADCKAATTAKRNALCNALNIVIAQDCINEDGDAGIEGDPNAKVTLAQADELERRVQETNSNRDAFLKFCNAKSFSAIEASRYSEADALLRRKEKQGR